VAIAAWARSGSTACARKQRAVRNGAAPWDGELTLLFESPAADVLHMPDNICVTPWQTLMVCEDNGGTTYLRGVTPQGAIFPFAQNIAPGFETTEFAGACFSPDGQTLFVNMQGVGATLAIWGPWIT
jgi:secreted PhoX family phosphatase